MKTKPIIENQREIAYRIYATYAPCWSIRYGRKRCPAGSYKHLLRRSLITKSGRLTDLGCAMAYKHSLMFKAMKPPERNISDEQRTALSNRMKNGNRKA